MSKKMKRVAGETPPLLPPPYGGGGGGVYEDAKARLKHQTLLQDYQELQKETDEMRNKLSAAKQRKLRLLAETRFLRQRRNYLLKMKSLNRPQEPPVNSVKQRNLSMKGRNSQKREAALFKLPPLPPPPDPKHRGRMHSWKEATVRNVASALDLNRRQQTLDSGKEATQGSLTPVAELNHRKRMSSGKEAAVQNAEPAFNLNQSQKVQVVNDTTFARRTPVFDLNQETSLSGKETTLCNRARIFDLNEISTEEEVEISNEPLKFEEPKIGTIRGGNEEQPNDLKLSVCRNAGEGSSRMGKRKISWQDPVALRV